MRIGQRPRVLIVNDDGVDAPGIKLLEQIAREFTDEVWVVAPNEERSGVGHSISIVHPIRVRQLDERRFAVNGSPTDCALLGINEFMGGEKPDILLSGINAGPNLAEDVTYSGTCAAAMEGAMLGIPAVALSQMRTYDTPPNWETSARHLPAIIETLLEANWRPGAFVNVNVPNVAPEAVKGVRLTRQGLRPPGSFMPVLRLDERRVPYYWIRVEHADGGAEPGTDLDAVRENAISITPLQIDMTNAAMAGELAALFPAPAPQLAAP